jgi:hypothetical protein
MEIAKTLTKNVMAGMGCAFFEPRKYKVTEKNLSAKRFVFDICLTNYLFQLVCEPSAVSMEVAQVDFDPDIHGAESFFTISNLKNCRFQRNLWFRRKLSTNKAKKSSRIRKLESRQADFR